MGHERCNEYIEALDIGKVSWIYLEQGFREVGTSVVDKDVYVLAKCCMGLFHDLSWGVQRPDIRLDLDCRTDLKCFDRLNDLIYASFVTGRRMNDGSLGKLVN